MFKINTNDVSEFESHLKTFANKAFPFATKATINTAAFQARRQWQRNINVEMVTRNKFTERSIRVEQSKTLIVDRQEAIVGSIAPYMDEQEFGGVKRKNGSEGVPLATGFAAGQDGQQTRTKLPRKPNNLKNIRLRKNKRRSTTNKQALLFKVQDAVTSGKRYIFHDGGGGRKKGIFKVVGGSRNFKRGRPRGAKLRMVWDMTNQVVVIPRNPTLKPAVDRTKILMPDMYIKALKFQIQRAGLFN